MAHTIENPTMDQALENCLIWLENLRACASVGDEIVANAMPAGIRDHKHMAGMVERKQAKRAARGKS